MILKLKYEDVINTAVRGDINGKQVTFFMRVEVNEGNIVEALEKVDGYKSVIAFDYTGNTDFLKTVELKTKPVLVTKELDTLDINVDFIMNDLGKDIKVVINLPSTFHDMKSVHDFSTKYSNIRFCGGRFIRLEGCNIGCLTQDEIPKKVPETRIPVTTEGCACIMKNFYIDDVDGIEFFAGKTVAEKKPKTKSNQSDNTQSAKKKPKPKKNLSSLLDLVSTDNLDNF